jgi:hypothetical protein
MASPAAHPLLSRVLDPSAPRPLKLAAARGALPLPRQDMIIALVRLASEADADIASESRKTLSGTPVETLQGILQDPETPAPVLDHFGLDPGTPPALLRLIVAHPAAADDLLLQLAGSSDATVLEHLVGNETRLAAVPALVARLKANPALSRDARRRIIELEEHVLGKGGRDYALPRARPVEEAPAEAVSEELPSVDAALPETAGPLLEIPLTPEEQAAEEALRKTPLFQRIVRMTAAEKIQAAVKGNAEERAILVRDPSRIVSTTVLKSPKLNYQEIESFANLRNVHDEVLRIIGTHREWTKSYNVAHALTRNPRTPTGISLTMLNRLVNRDLKNLSNDKNIPEVIRRSAKRLYDLRTQAPAKGKRK